jgi:hypothetical protein
MGALDDLERAGLRVHATDGDHERIGKRRLTARVDVSIGEPHGRTIALSIGGGSTFRQLPLTTHQAEAMVRSLEGTGAFKPTEHVVRMLELLLLHVAETAEDLDLRTLVLDPVAVAEDGYCIDAAALTYHRSPRHARN